jgi:hypothetical protein
MTMAAAQRFVVELDALRQQPRSDTPLFRGVSPTSPSGRGRGQQARRGFVNPRGQSQGFGRSGGGGGRGGVQGSTSRGVGPPPARRGAPSGRGGRFAPSGSVGLHTERPVTCWYCDTPGHREADCPDKAAGKPRKGIRGGSKGSAPSRSKN